MSKARATFNVGDLKSHVNKRLKESTCSPAERMAMASVLEHVLHDTGNYKGFGFLEDRTENGKLISTGDDSRRCYY